MNFLDFFLIVEIFFCFEKTIKSRNLNVFAKRLRTTLKEFLDNRSKLFANTTQTFFDKRGFRKLLKNLNKFVCQRQKNFG